jgi:hypothetical protein
MPMLTWLELELKDKAKLLSNFFGNELVILAETNARSCVNCAKYKV